MNDGYSLAYGARFLKRVIESRIKLPISQRWTEGHALHGRRAGRHDRGRGAASESGRYALAATA